MTRPRDWKRWPIAAGIVVILLVGIAIGVAAAGGHDKRATRVRLFGDSLVLQASNYWLTLMRNAHFDAQQSSYAGTNTCDWFAKMQQVRDHEHPDIVVMSFGGNDLTKCMHHADGSALSPAEFTAKFRADTEHAVSIFGPKTTIYLVAPPAMYTGDNRFGPTYQAIAAEHPNVHYVDGGRILTPGRVWNRTLPCLANEQCTGPVVNGTREAIVRAPDKIHFCPVATKFGAPCPVYSPGAYRYALTIYEALRAGTTR